MNAARSRGMVMPALLRADVGGSSSQFFLVCDRHSRQGVIPLHCFSAKFEKPGKPPFDGYQACRGTTLDKKNGHLDYA